MKTTLIGLTGPMGCGKDTVADFLIKDFGFKKHSFALPLKQAAAAALGVGIEFFQSQEMKKQIIPHWDFTPREFLQRLGTDLIRNNIRQDFWIHRIKFELQNANGEFIPGRHVITDCRFEDEAAFIRSGGVLIHIHRPGLERSNGSTHASEAGVIGTIGDFELVNASDLKDLRHTVYTMMTQMGIYP